MTNRWMPMNILRCVCCAFLLGLAWPLSAQTACPTGVAAGSAACGPSAPAPSAAPPPPPVTLYEWREDGWGAFSTDNELPALGASFGAPSREEAIRRANRECERNGGDRGRCGQDGWIFRNTCSAFAHGETFISARHGLTLRMAEHAALTECGRQAPSGRCKILESGCSNERYLGAFPMPQPGRSY